MMAPAFPKAPHTLPNVAWEARTDINHVPSGSSDNVDRTPLLVSPKLEVLKEETRSQTF